MAKAPKVTFIKGLIIVSALAIVTLAAGVASIVLLSHNRSIMQVFGGADNVYESARLEKLTFNGYALGDTLSGEALEYHAIDAGFSHYYDGVAFWTDSNEVITGLGFYTMTTSVDDEIFVDMDDSDIRYEKRRLVTRDDFEETFGIGEEEKDDRNESTITYRQGNYKLTLQLRDKSVYDVILRQY